MSELLINGVVVVFEGLSRLQWRRVTADRWTLTGAWPAPRRRHALLEALHSGDRALVVLAPGIARSTLFEEELPDAFEQDMPSAHKLVVHPDPDAGLVDIVVPPLNWLSEEHRAHGLRFAEWARRQVATLPRLGLPQLMLDDRFDRNLRFAYPTGPVTPDHRALLEPFVELAFQESRCSA
jgi:hypothetical protein